ncbi:DUF1488 domain-containing protein [Vibrio makurazakiensis]|uniref:DUF1488 domain-containing protein n=1 Tax=Vibrio makurazakiensis TaxID=2910250 RepID=UPI003D14A390
MNQSIFFPDIQTWDEAEQRVIFPAQESGALIECYISLGSLERLASKTITSSEQAIATFNELRFEIEELAEELIEEEEYDSSGNIQIV